MTETQFTAKEMKIDKIHYEIEDNLDCSYHIHELLTGDTFSRWIPEIKWKVSRGTKDGGVDFLGKTENYLFRRMGLNINENYFGEVKAGNNFEQKEFPIILNDLSNRAEKEKAFAIFLVIYRKKKQDLTNYQKRLDSDEYRRFFASRFIIGEEKFLKDWASRPKELLKMFPKLERDKKKTITDYLKKFQNDDTPSFKIDIDLSDFDKDKKISTGEYVKFILHLTHDCILDREKITIKYILPKGKYICLRPSKIISDDGINITLQYQESLSIPILFKTYDIGEKIPYGRIEVYDSKKNRILTKQLPNFTSKEYFSPPLFETPLIENIRKVLQEQQSCFNKKKISSVIVTGNGGIGKSRFCDHIVDIVCAEGAEWVQIEHPKNMLESNIFIKKLVISLLPFSDNAEIVNAESIIKHVKKFFSEWEEDYTENIRNLFDDSRSDTHINPYGLIDIIIFLLSQKQKKNDLIFHFSNLHWANEKTFTILRILNDKLRVLENILSNGIFFLFEGRANEVLSINNDAEPIVATHWNQFKKDYSNDFLTIKLENWKDTFSKEFIENIICTNMNKLEQYSYKEDGPYVKKLINFLMERSKGNPMHILEQIRFLNDNGYINQASFGQWYVVKKLDKTIKIPEKIEELIKLRIDYLKINNKEAIELMTVIAKIGLSIPQILFLRLYNLLDKKQKVSLDQSGIAVTKNGQFTFNHENYYAALSEYDIESGSSFLRLASKWYEELKSRAIRDKLAYVKLLFIQENFAVMYEECVNGYTQSKQLYTDIEKYEFINYLLQYDETTLKSNNFDRLELKFEQAGSLGVFGNWEDASEIMVEIADECESAGEDYNLLQIKALANASNKIISLQRPDDAENLINRALSIAKSNLHNNSTDEHKLEFQRMHDLLLHRIAVARWFDGKYVEAVCYQRKAFSSIRNYKDKCIEDWCEIHRELGATLQHRRPGMALKFFDRSIEIYDSNKTKIHPLHNLLTYAEAYIAQLIKETLANNKSEIGAIAISAGNIYEKSLRQNTLTEAVFTALVAGSAYAFLDDNELALIWFRNATTVAIDCQRQDEIWKARLNLAQIYFILGDKKQAKLQAMEAANLIILGLKHNPENRLARRKLLSLPLYHCKRLKGIDNKTFKTYADKEESKKMKNWNIRPGSYSSAKETQQVLHVRKGEYDYFLIN